MWRRIRGGSKGIWMKEILPNRLMISSFSVKKKYQRQSIRVYENKVRILRKVTKFYCKIYR